jgi:hypothetical protein
MKSLTALLGSFLVLAPLAATASAAEQIAPLRSWSGHATGKAKGKAGAAPEAPPPALVVIKDAKTWQEAWQRCRGKEALPRIDFTREMALLASVPGQNTVVFQELRLAEGALSGRIVSTKNIGPGLSYCIVVVPSRGVTRVEVR